MNALKCPSKVLQNLFSFNLLGLLSDLTINEKIHIFPEWLILYIFASLHSFATSFGNDGAVYSSFGSLQKRKIMRPYQLQIIIAIIICSWCWMNLPLVIKYYRHYQKQPSPTLNPPGIKQWAAAAVLLIKLRTKNLTLSSFVPPLPSSIIPFT